MSRHSNLINHLKNPFKQNWIESFQLLVIAFGIIISGIWAYFTFETLLQKDKAESELELVQRNLVKAQSELKILQEKISGTVSSNIEIIVKDINLQDKRKGIIITVKVKNTGTQDVDMSWDGSPLVVHRVKFKDEKIKSTKSLSPKVYKTLSTDKEKNPTHVGNLHLFVGATKELSFFVEINDPGLYYIIFEANIDKKVQSKLNGKDGVWLATKYHHSE
ncbi:hypothetical protein [Shewanella algae]|uniref:hypothetical protein n=1 Tax=Shewanella algae TaxID=38313 RepID=UPI0031F598CB